MISIVSTASNCSKLVLSFNDGELIEEEIEVCINSVYVDTTLVYWMLMGGALVVVSLKILWIVLVYRMGTISWESAGFILVCDFERKLAPSYAAGIFFLSVSLKIHAMHT